MHFSRDSEAYAPQHFSIFHTSLVMRPLVELHPQLSGPGVFHDLHCEPKAIALARIYSD